MIRRMIGSRRFLPVLVPALACATPASAHLQASGMGPIVDGLSHLLTSVEDLAMLGAVGLLAGSAGPRAARQALAAVGSGWLGAGLLVMAVAVAPAGDAVRALLIVAAGLLLAMGRRPGSWAVAIAAALAGLVGGASSLGGVGWSVPAIVSLLAMTVGAMAVLILTASLTLGGQAGWAKVAARIAGAWLAALGLLLLGWSWHRAVLA